MWYVSSLLPWKMAELGVGDASRSLFWCSERVIGGLMTSQSERVKVKTNQVKSTQAETRTLVYHSNYSIIEPGSPLL